MLQQEGFLGVTVSADREPFDGDARMFRLGVEAQRLGLAYEYDPFFSLSIARVDPLPHQLEAVYSYFMKLTFGLGSSDETPRPVHRLKTPWRG